MEEERIIVTRTLRSIVPVATIVGLNIYSSPLEDKVQYRAIYCKHKKKYNSSPIR